MFQIALDKTQNRIGFAQNFIYMTCPFYTLMYCNSKVWSLFIILFEEVIILFTMAAIRVLTSMNWNEITLGYIKPHTPIFYPFSMEASSCWSSSWSGKECIDLYSKQSSANNLSFDVTLWRRSFMWPKKQWTYSSTLRYSRVIGAWLRGNLIQQ